MDNEIIKLSVNTSVQILLATILQEYLTSNCLTIITERSLIVDVPKSAIRLSPSDDLVARLINATEMGCLDYVIQIEKPQQFLVAFEEVTHVTNVRKSDRKLVFIFEELSNDSKDDILAVMMMKETSFVPNILFIYPSENDNDNFNLVTHRYVGEIDKAHEPIILDQWNSYNRSFIKKVNLFPHDMSNLYEKTVKVSCFTYKPYIILDLDKLVTPLGRDGIEVRILQEFCRWINCSIQLVREDEHLWGEIYENRTGIGVLGSVLEDKSDFGIAALYSWFEEYAVLDFSASCLRTSVTCIAPAPLLLSSWQTPFLPFSAYMWCAIFATFVFSAGALTVAQGFSADKIFLSSFGILITQSQFLEDSWRIRSVTIWLLLMGLVIDNAYSGGLASTFTVPKYEPSYDTMKDIVDRNLEWGATHDAWLFSLLSSEDETIKSLIKLFRTRSFDDLQRKSFTRSMAYSIEKLPGGYFAIGEYITEDAVSGLMLLLEDFYYEYTVIMMKKSSAFTKKLSVLIGRLHQSGLMLAWEKQYVRLKKILPSVLMRNFWSVQFLPDRMHPAKVALKYLNYKVQTGVRQSRSKHDVETVEPLNLEQFMGIYLIYVVGVISSTCLFLMELLYIRRKKLTKSIN